MALAAPKWILKHRHLIGGVHDADIVLFEVKDADPINFTLYEAEKLAYTFGQRDNTWFAKKSSLRGAISTEAAAEDDIPGMIGA